MIFELFVLQSVKFPNLIGNMRIITSFGHFDRGSCVEFKYAKWKKVHHAFTNPIKSYKYFLTLRTQYLHNCVDCVSYDRPIFVWFFTWIGFYSHAFKYIFAKKNPENRNNNSVRKYNSSKDRLLFIKYAEYLFLYVDS